MTGFGYTHDGDVWEVATYSSAFKPTPDLVKVPDRAMGYTIASKAVHFDFTISDEEFWDVLTKVDAFNAPVLIDLYYDDPRQITRLFINHEIEHLLRDNTRLVEAARKHQVPLERYLELYFLYYDNRRTEDELIRVFELHEKFSDSEYARTELLPELLHGRIRETDVTTIGHRVLEENKTLSNLVLALNALKSGKKVGYTADHIRQILIDPEPHDGAATINAIRVSDQYKRVKFSRISLLLNIGGDRTLTVQNPVRVAKLILNIWRGEKGTRTDEPFIGFVDRLAALTPELPSHGMASELCDTGVDVEFAAEQMNSGPWTVRSIVAAYDGAPVPLTSGWL